MQRQSVGDQVCKLLENRSGLFCRGRVSIDATVVQLARLTKGVAFYTSSGELANCIMESYLSGRKKKAYIA